MTEPTGYTAVGMVGFTDKGTYSASASYVKNDLVHYGGSIWCCLIDDTTGITPTEGTNWTLFVGEPTNMAERIIAPLEVSPSENAYSIGEQLIFNDVLYKAKTAIAVGDALVVNTNIEVAPKISSQIQTLTNETNTIVNELGAKNLIPCQCTTQVKNGVTFTVNSDGSVTANGTATSDTYFWYGRTQNGANLVANKRYILNGCPPNMNGNCDVHYTNTVSNLIFFDYGDGVEIVDPTVGSCDVWFYIKNGITVNNLVFKPMIRPSSIVDDTYVPYAMTNRELTKPLYGNYVASKMYSKLYPLDATKTYRQFLYGVSSDFSSTIMSQEATKGNIVMPLGIIFLNTRFKPDLAVLESGNTLRIQDETTGDTPNLVYGLRMYENANYCYLSKKLFSANGVAYTDLSDVVCNSALRVVYTILTPIK
jgi:hypothetical protein